jgi:hypothetical protein
MGELRCSGEAEGHFRCQEGEGAVVELEMNGNNGTRLTAQVGRDVHAQMIGLKSMVPTMRA